MSQNKKEFFSEKKQWSVIKDNLLECYFKPYFEKIIHTKSPIFYVDCFSGKGKFDSGEEGSPLIVLRIIDEIIKNHNNDLCSLPNIKTYFIDLKYADILSHNLPKTTSKREINIIAGKYEEKIQDILFRAKNANVFLYIDPYGIKALNVEQIRSFQDEYSLKSIEVLINFNSFGFYRQACNVLSICSDSIISKEMDEFLIESEPTKINTEEEMNKVFGSNEWKSIIINGKNKGKDVFHTEIQLSNCFCDNLRKKFKYVLNMPIRKGTEKNPKYRMVHATNHPDGCLLMADNMYKRSIQSRDIRLNGQTSLFDLDVNDIDVTLAYEGSKLISLISDKWTNCKELFCMYYSNNGITASVKELFQILKDNVKQNNIQVKRTPSITNKGKPTEFWSFGKEKSIYVKKIG